MSTKTKVTIALVAGATVALIVLFLLYGQQFLWVLGLGIAFTLILLLLRASGSRRYRGHYDDSEKP